MTTPAFIRDGIYRIGHYSEGTPSGASTTYLELQSTSLIAAVPPNTANDSQKWKIVSGPDGTFKIICISGDQVLGINGSNRIVGDGRDSKHTWTIEPRGLSFVIGNAADQLVVHITEAGRVRLFDRNNSISQRWVFDLISLDPQPPQDASPNNTTIFYSPGGPVGSHAWTSFGGFPVGINILATRLVEIRMRISITVRGIQMVHSYEGETLVHGWYGLSAHEIQTFRLKPDEYIVKIAGSSSTAINCLLFTTNRGRSSPLYGQAAFGNPFTWSADPRYPLSGLGWLSGTSNSSNDSLSLIPYFFNQA